jgi:hypothetical protein
MYDSMYEISLLGLVSTTRNPEDQTHGHDDIECESRSQAGHASSILVARSTTKPQARPYCGSCGFVVSEASQAASCNERATNQRAQRSCVGP